ncbi:uncharacterized protein L969DRAFT_47607 [Mixia osmundae IAM 14324]|uniref:Uncharacterized protein n=1 Tax=Mixia osmundae (strain CBS 9802 / IAM 14324 / JCM 22182 / KY 12970) TaxID=764103 RepID=G7E8Y2_MIXOS|nr:uncharacterized protein L969DRAFT_47607 [Mixia osmundae IAM 14324]KEI40234.1 hypothetical protein L969DRAFT_47607 [Mixia osmundae IAM 14324]GAA99600.1 hypothetical protein E5Q_06301 [Mixia osmundae IAM 14324]
MTDDASQNDYVKDLDHYDKETVSPNPSSKRRRLDEPGLAEPVVPAEQTAPPAAISKAAVDVSPVQRDAEPSPDAIEPDSADARLDRVRQAMRGQTQRALAEDSDSREFGQLSTVTCFYPSAAQKSYSSEKRFVVPPPFVRIQGPLQTAASLMTLSAHLRLTDNTVLLDYTSPLDRTACRAHFAQLHIGGITKQEGKEKVKGCHLEVSLHNKPQEELQRQQALRDIELKKRARKLEGEDELIRIAGDFKRRDERIPVPRLPAPFATFVSEQIRIVSKPAENSRVTRQNPKGYLQNGSLMGLLSRQKNQTARTRFLTTEGGCFTGHANLWSAFRINVIERGEDLVDHLLKAIDNGEEWDPSAETTDRHLSPALHMMQTHELTQAMPTLHEHDVQVGSSDAALDGVPLAETDRLRDEEQQHKGSPIDVPIDPVISDQVIREITRPKRVSKARAHSPASKLAMMGSDVSRSFDQRLLNSAVKYGDLIVLTDVNTGDQTGPLWVRSVEQDRTVPMATGPVSYLQRIALQRATKPKTRPAFLTTNAFDHNPVRPSNKNQKGRVRTTVEPPQLPHGEDSEQDYASNEMGDGRVLKKTALAPDLVFRHALSGRPTHAEMITDSQAWTVLLIDKFAESFFCTNADGSLPIDTFTPMPQVITKPIYDDVRKTLDLAIKHLSYTTEDGGDTSVEIWIGSLGPLPVELSQRPPPVDDLSVVPITAWLPALSEICKAASEAYVNTRYEHQGSSSRRPVVDIFEPGTATDPHKQFAVISALAMSSQPGSAAQHSYDFGDVSVAQTQRDYLDPDLPGMSGLSTLAAAAVAAGQEPGELESELDISRAFAQRSHHLPIALFRSADEVGFPSGYDLVLMPNEIEGVVSWDITIAVSTRVQACFD